MESIEKQNIHNWKKGISDYITYDYILENTSVIEKDISLRYFHFMFTHAPVTFDKRLDELNVGYDIGSYRSAPPGLRIWGGPTIDSEDIQHLLPWLDWAYNETLKKLNII